MGLKVDATKGRLHMQYFAEDSYAFMMQQGENKTCGHTIINRLT